MRLIYYKITLQKKAVEGLIWTVANDNNLCNQIEKQQQHTYGYGNLQNTHIQNKHPGDTLYMSLSCIGDNIMLYPQTFHLAFLKTYLVKFVKEILSITFMWMNLKSVTL